TEDDSDPAQDALAARIEQPHHGRQPGAPPVEDLRAGERDTLSTADNSATPGTPPRTRRQQRLTPAAPSDSPLRVVLGSQTVIRRPQSVWRPLARSRRQADRDAAQLGGPFQKRHRTWQQQLPCRGERHRAPIPVEQAGTEVSLKGPDLLGQRAPGDAQPLRRATEAELFGDGDEVAQLAKLRLTTAEVWEVVPTSREDADRGGSRRPGQRVCLSPRRRERSSPVALTGPAARRCHSGPPAAGRCHRGRRPAAIVC
ncbi:MAG: hypothetical protein QOI35_472, partial [Cryptosporangiaceae bacterium]|nr:hypothetical protein [Cryptosporangiaceae bacterium]